MITEEEALIELKTFNPTVAWELRQSTTGVRVYKNQQCLSRGDTLDTALDLVRWYYLKYLSPDYVSALRRLVEPIKEQTP
jgi:hypothetical protein